MCNPTKAILSSQKTLLYIYFFFLKSNQNVLLCLPHRATFVPHLLEPWTATTLVTIAAADIVLRTSHSRVSLTRPLGLDTGSQHFALQKAVAVMVSTVLMELSKCVLIIVKDSLHRSYHLPQLPLWLSSQPWEDWDDPSGAGADHLLTIHCIRHWTLWQQLCLRPPDNHGRRRDNFDGKELWWLLLL